jgi:hypothetical protein
VYNNKNAFSHEQYTQLQSNLKKGHPINSPRMAFKIIDKWYLFEIYYIEFLSMQTDVSQCGLLFAGGLYSVVVFNTGLTVSNLKVCPLEQSPTHTTNFVKVYEAILLYAAKYYLNFEKECF